MEFNKEKMWQTFVHQAQELFNLGYNLPAELQVQGMEEVQTKLTDWEHTLTSQTSNDGSNDQCPNIEIVTDNIANVNSSRITPIFTFTSISDSIPLNEDSICHVEQQDIVSIDADGSRDDSERNYADSVLLIKPNNVSDNVLAQMTDDTYEKPAFDSEVDRQDASKMKKDGLTHEIIEVDSIPQIENEGFLEETMVDGGGENSATLANVKTKSTPSPRRSSRKRKGKRKLDMYITGDDMQGDANPDGKMYKLSENSYPDDDFPKIVHESVNATESREIIIKMETTELDDSGEAQLVSDIMKEAIEQAAIIPDDSGSVDGVIKTTRKARYQHVGRPRKNVTVADALFSGMNLDFKCSNCVRSYGSQEVLDSHMESHKTKQPYVCAICKKSYSSKGGFDNHIRGHDPDNQSQCPYCNFRCPTYAVMNRHVSLRHDSSRPFLCNFCGKGFLSQSGLNVHLASHSGEKRFLCDLCDFRTHTKNILGIHKKNMHSEKDFYECELCFAKLKYKASMAEHRRRHLGEKPHACATCGSKFTTRSQLAQHVRIHKEKTFTCQVCDKKFINKHKLARHETIHTGMKEYACGFCNYRCNVRGNIRKHWLFVHKMDHDRRMVRVKVMDPEGEECKEIPSPENAEVVLDARPLKISTSPKTRTKKRIKVEEQRREILKEQDDNENVGHSSSGRHNELVKVPVSTQLEVSSIQTLNSSDGHTILADYSLVQPSSVHKSSSTRGKDNSNEQTIEVPIEPENLSTVVQEDAYPTGVNVETKVEVSEDGTQLVYLYFQDTDSDQIMVENPTLVARNEYVVSMADTETQQATLSLDQM